MQGGDGVGDGGEPGVRGHGRGGDHGAGVEGQQGQTSSCQLTGGASSCSCLDDGGLLLGHQARVQARGLDLKLIYIEGKSFNKNAQFVGLSR